jgi:hypothetical protein
MLTWLKAGTSMRTVSVASCGYLSISWGHRGQQRSVVKTRSVHHGRHLV